MEVNKRNTPAKLTLFCVIYAVIIIINSLLVINSPHLFVRVLNLIVVIALSIVIGAFIREIFILRNAESSE
ncbi:hypothetical protein [Radiobacillus sp. PE A8.2]|uniref:hypothetical protein n=1 Tax=Radiobacillus sp. PE A8.2 TaxID=3380349 RepID=UPI00388F3B9F